MKNYENNPNAECIGYGVKYRDMHTAMHGIFWSEEYFMADYLESILRNLERALDDDDYDYNLQNLNEAFIGDGVYDESEIDWRDVTYDNRYYLNDDEYIQVINNNTYDLYG